MGMRTILVTGGAGFMGSNFVLAQRARHMARIINVDLLTYSGNLLNLDPLANDPDHVFVHGDIADSGLINNLLADYQPSSVVNFAAESHVDRSIATPGHFIGTNVVGTFHLLEALRHYCSTLSIKEKDAFRFLHVSTDEVYGSLAPGSSPSCEESPYAPNSPYAASKAAGDFFVRAYHRTYGLPAITVNCSNNYGPRQFPEKLIPLVVLNALHGEPLPLYGDGRHIRDWLYVEDTCEALHAVLTRGRVGQRYNIGGRCERRNMEIVRTICRILDDILPHSPYTPHESLIVFTKDRPGHDQRYALDCSKAERELGWMPRKSLDEGLRETIKWYLANDEWVKSVRTGAYAEWVRGHYGWKSSRDL